MGDLIGFGDSDVAALDNNGFVLSRGFYDKNLMQKVKENIDRYATLDHPGIVKELDGETLRGIHGPHLFDDFFKSFVEDPRLLEIAQKVIGEPCYLHQFKINMKQKMTGEAWPWHEDFVYWNEKDAIELPKLLNIALLIDDADIISGPMCFIPGSHRREHQYEQLAEHNQQDWKNDVSADLNYQINSSVVADMMESWGVAYATGKAGDLLVFDPQVAHCSASNLSPYDRRLLILTFNAVSNAPQRKTGRPEFLCGSVTEK